MRCRKPECDGCQAVDRIVNAHNGRHWLAVLARALVLAVGAS